MNRYNNNLNKGMLWLLLSFGVFLAPLHVKLATVVIVVVSSLLIFSDRNNSFSKFRSLPKDTVFLFLLIFVIIYYLGLLNTIDMKLGFRRCKRVSTILAMYVLFKTLLKDPQDGLTLLKWLGLGTALLAVLALVKFLAVGMTKSFVFPTIVAVKCPIWFGDLCAVGVYICGVMVLFGLSRRTDVNVYLWSVATWLCLVGVFLSRSRGPWVSLLIVTSIIFIPRLWRVHAGRVFLFFLVIIFVSLSIAPSMREKLVKGMQDVREYFEEHNIRTSVGARLEMWKLAVEIAKENPLFGIGTGDYKEIMKKKAKGDLRFLQRFTHPHNMYLHALVMHGLIGFISVLLLLGSIFIKSIKQIKNENVAKKMLSLITLSVLLHYALSGLTEANIRVRVLATIFGIVLGCCMGYEDDK